MSKEALYNFIESNQPVSQEDIESKFGDSALKFLQELMAENRINYDSRWRIVIKDE